MSDGALASRDLGLHDCPKIEQAKPPPRIGGVEGNLYRKVMRLPVAGPRQHFRGTRVSRFSSIHPRVPQEQACSLPRSGVSRESVLSAELELTPPEV
jgi:hypothetical protein